METRQCRKILIHNYQTKMSTGRLVSRWSDFFVFKMDQEIEFRNKIKKKDYKIEEHTDYFDYQKQENMIEESKQTEHDEINKHANQELLEFDSDNDCESEDEETQLN